MLTKPIKTKEEAHAIFEKCMEEPLDRIRTIAYAVCERDGEGHTRSLRPEMERLGFTHPDLDERWYAKAFSGSPLFTDTGREYEPLVDGERTRKHEARDTKKPIKIYIIAERFRGITLSFNPLVTQPGDAGLWEKIKARILARLTLIANVHRMDGRADVEVFLRGLAKRDGGKLYTAEEIADMLAIKDWDEWDGL